MARMYRHRCVVCRDRFESSRPHARTCGPTCRAEKSRKATGKDTRTSGKGKALRGVAKRRTRRVGKRADTTYAVLRVHRAEFHLIGKCDAHDRESAVREVAGGKRGLYIAVPARSLSLLTEEGRPDGAT